MRFTQPLTDLYKNVRKEAEATGAIPKPKPKPKPKTQRNVAEFELDGEKFVIEWDGVGDDADVARIVGGVKAQVAGGANVGAKSGAMPIQTPRPTTPPQQRQTVSQPPQTGVQGLMQRVQQGTTTQGVEDAATLFREENRKNPEVTEAFGKIPTADEVRQGRKAGESAGQFASRKSSEATEAVKNNPAFTALYEFVGKPGMQGLAAVGLKPKELAAGIVTSPYDMTLDISVLLSQQATAQEKAGAIANLFGTDLAGPLLGKAVGVAAKALKNKQAAKALMEGLKAYDMTGGGAKPNPTSVLDEVLGEPGVEFRAATPGREKLTDAQRAAMDANGSTGDFTTDATRTIEMLNAQRTGSVLDDVLDDPAQTVTPDANPLETRQLPDSQSVGVSTTPTSARQSDINADMEALGKAGFSTDEVRTWEELAQKADPNDVPMEAGSWTDQQTVNATIRMHSLKAKYDELNARAKSGDIDAANEAADIADELQELARRRYEAGTEQGRALASRKFDADLDMSAPVMKARLVRAYERAGANPTPKQLVDVDRMAAQYEEALAKIKELEDAKPIDLDALTPNDPRIDPMHYDGLTDTSMFDPVFVNRAYVELFGELPDSMPIEARAKAVREGIQSRAQKAIEEDIRASNVGLLRDAIAWFKRPPGKMDPTATGPGHGWNVAVPGRYPGDFVAGARVRMISTEDIPPEFLQMFMDWYPSRSSGAERYIKGSGKNFNDAKLFGTDTRSAADRGLDGRVAQIDELFDLEGGHGLIPQPVADEFVRDLVRQVGDDLGAPVVKRQRRAHVDAEFDDLVSQFKKVALGSAKSGIPVELVPVVGKMVANRIKAGVLTIEEIVEAIQKKFTERLLDPPTRQDIIDAYAEYKAQPKEEPSKQVVEARRQRAELQKQMREESSQRKAYYAEQAEAKAAKRAEDAKESAEKATRGVERAKNAESKRKAQDAKKQADAILREADAEYKRLQDARAKSDTANRRRAKRLEDLDKRIAEYEAAISAESKVKPKAKKPQTDPRIVEASAKLKEVRARYDAMLSEADKLWAERFTSGVTGIKLLNPVSRAKDLAANGLMIADQFGLTGVAQQAISGGAYRSPLLNPSKTRRVIDRAKRDPIWRQWLAEGKFETRGLGGKMAGVTDIPAKMFVYHSTLDDLARLEWQKMGRNMKDGGFDEFVERFAMDPPEDAVAIAMSEAIMDTFNATTALKRGSDSMLSGYRKFAKQGTTQKVAAETAALVQLNMTRFANTLLNVAKDRAARSIPFAGEVTGLARYGLEKRRGTFGVQEQREISRLIAKGAVGTAGFAAGYYGLHSLFGSGGAVVADADGGSSYWKWESEVMATLEELGGAASPVMLGAIFRTIDDAPTRADGAERADNPGLSEKEKSAIKKKLMVSALTNTPLTTQIKNMAGVLAGEESALGKTAASWFSVAPLQILAERYDAAVNNEGPLGVFGKAPQRDTSPPDSGPIAKMGAPIAKNIPIVRQQLPERKEKTIYKP